MRFFIVYIAAAAIREASLNQHSPSPKKIKLSETVTSASTSNDAITGNLSRKRDEIFYTKDDEKPDEKIDFIMEQKKLEKEKVESKDKKDTKLKDKQTAKTNSKKEVDKNSTQSPKPGSSKDEQSSRKRKSDKVKDTPNKRKKKQLKKPFYQLFSDVTIVISGIENPERGNIRAMVLTMGGKYKGDWDNTCTHLM